MLIFDFGKLWPIVEIMREIQISNSQTDHYSYPCSKQNSNEIPTLQQISKLQIQRTRGGSWRCISYFSLDLSDIIPHFFEQWPVLRKTVHARFCARKRGYLFFENHKRQQKDNINGFGSQSNLLPQKPIFVVVLWKPSLLCCWIGNGMSHCLMVFEVMVISSSMAPFLACSGMMDFCSLGYV